MQILEIQPSTTKMLDNIYKPEWEHSFLSFSAKTNDPPYQRAEGFDNEALRLLTFREMTSSVPIPTKRLARAGFYYSGEWTGAVCFSCGGRLREWGRGIDPAVQHCYFFPDCPLMKGTGTENVPNFPVDEAVFDSNKKTNGDPCPKLANTRYTPSNHGGNVSSLLSRSLGICTLEVATPHVRPLGSTAMVHSRAASGERSNENTFVPSPHEDLGLIDWGFIDREPLGICSPDFATPHAKPLGSNTMAHFRDVSGESSNENTFAPSPHEEWEFLDWNTDDQQMQENIFNCLPNIRQELRTYPTECQTQLFLHKKLVVPLCKETQQDQRNTNHAAWPALQRSFNFEQADTTVEHATLPAGSRTTSVLSISGDDKQSLRDLQSLHYLILIERGYVNSESFTSKITDLENMLREQSDAPLHFYHKPIESTKYNTESTSRLLCTFFILVTLITASAEFIYLCCASQTLEIHLLIVVHISKPIQIYCNSQINACHVSIPETQFTCGSHGQEKHCYFNYVWIEVPQLPTNHISESACTFYSLEKYFRCMKMGYCCEEFCPGNQSSVEQANGVQCRPVHTCFDYRTVLTTQIIRGNISLTLMQFSGSENNMAKGYCLNNFCILTPSISSIAIEVRLKYLPFPYLDFFFFVQNFADGHVNISPNDVCFLGKSTFRCHIQRHFTLDSEMTAGLLSRNSRMQDEEKKNKKTETNSNTYLTYCDNWEPENKCCNGEYFGRKRDYFVLFCFILNSIILAILIALNLMKDGVESSQLKERCAFLDIIDKRRLLVKADLFEIPCLASINRCLDEIKTLCSDAKYDTAVINKKSITQEYKDHCNRRCILENLLPLADKAKTTSADVDDGNSMNLCYWREQWCQLQFEEASSIYQSYLENHLCVRTLMFQTIEPIIIRRNLRYVHIPFQNTSKDNSQQIKQSIMGFFVTNDSTVCDLTKAIEAFNKSNSLKNENLAKDGKRGRICLAENLGSKKEKTSCHHAYQSDYTLLTKVSAQDNTVTTDLEFDHQTVTSSVQNGVAEFFNRDRVPQKEEVQNKCAKGSEGEEDDHNMYRQVSVFLHRDLFRYLTSYAPGRTRIHLYPLHLQEYFLRSAQGPPFRVGEEYCYEAVRLSSFKDLPNSVPVRATRLARSGFHYTGNSDEVVCFSCGGRLKEWTCGDNPLVRHRNFFPDCPLMNGTETENVPLFPRDDPVSNVNIGANVDPFPNLANTRPRPHDHGCNVPSLLSSQQALSRSLGISSPEVDIPQTTPLESSTVAHAGVASGVRSNENTSGLLTPHNASHLPTCVPSRMRNESDRLATFVNWPSGASVLPRDLARAGFFYVGTEDRVQCAFCEGILRNWEPGDQPMLEHRRYLSTCPFILGLEVGNISVEEPSTALPLAVSESQSHIVRGSTTGSENATTGATLGILTARPKHERYAIENTRVQTFADWPPSRIPRPEELAKAGFFYAGFGDNVKCFFCDGGLRNWEPQDDPWTEHARWFPRCGFVRQCKGDEFIRMIKERNSPNNPPPQAQAQTQRPQGAPGSYHVEAREIKARLDTPTVQAVLDMGFRRDAVRQVIEQRLRNTGDDFPSAASLLDAVLNIEDELNRQTAQGAAAMALIPQEEPGQQPLNAAPCEAPPRDAAQKTSQTQNTDNLSKKDKKKKKKKQNSPVLKDSDDKAIHHDDVLEPAKHGSTSTTLTPA